MKKSVISMFCSLLVVQTFAHKRDPEYLNARRNGARAKIELRTVNDNGEIVPDADVNVFMGMNFRDKGFSIVGRTDKKGIYVVEGNTCGDEINLNISKPGFYTTSRTFRFAEMGHEHEVVDGCWQPYGAVEEVILRDIRNPIDMPHEYFWKFKYTKAIKTWIGYDIKENDFVAPHGKGIDSDFEVFIDWDGAWIPEYTGMSVKIRFIDEFSGYYVCEVNRFSEFKGPYVALPGSISLTEAEFSEHVFDNGRRREKKMFDHGKCWVVRSRCKVSPDGKLLAANYSKIDGIAFTCRKGGYGGFCVTGAFNPTPNDTNLEDTEAARRSQHLIRQCEPPPARNK